MRSAAAALAAGAGLLAVTAPLAGAVTADQRAAQRGAAWLAASSTAAPGGQQADTIVALRAAGRPRAALAARVASLTRVAPGYAVTAGGAAKVALAAVAAGRDPRRLGGVDYLRRITNRYAGGRYGESAFDQGLSMLALNAGGRAVPPTAVRATLATRAGGGWGYTMSRTARDSVDATAIVIRGLRAAGLPASDPALRAATAWMLAQRDPSGGLATAGGGAPADANSTASAIVALRAMGRTPPASTRAALRALQQPDGSFRATRASVGSPLLATNDAVPALAGAAAPVR